MSEKRKSGAESGAENVAKLKAYLGGVDALPARNGKIAMTAIAEAAGVDRQALYRNPEAARLLEEAAAEKGLKGIEPRDDAEDGKSVVLERRITSLEQRNAALFAENAELRRQLKAYGVVEDLMTQGKRAIP